MYEFVYSQDAKLKRLCPFPEKSQEITLINLKEIGSKEIV
ncbi:hypothetical protein VDIAB_240004 [Vibrio diabolicus]|nr:hypothetical protein VDIAB_240004 [Vibrio diabolicus]